MQPVKTDPLSDEQFPAALDKGLGRAYWYINPENHEQHRAQLLHICTQNVTYDPHSEEDRAPWLFQLLEKTGAPDSYKEAIIQALYHAEDYYDWLHYLRFVAQFAYRDEDAFYAFCDNIVHSFSGKIHGPLADLLLGLAQQKGLDDVAGIIRESLIETPQHTPNIDLWRTIKDNLDVEDVLDPLLGWAASPNMWKYERCYTESIDDAAQILLEYPIAESSTLDELFAFAESEFGNNPHPYLVWAKEWATEEDLNVVFLRLIDEKRPELQLRYLWIFKEKALPRLDSKILYLAIDGPPEIQAAAIDALSNIQDSGLRNFIFTLLQNSPDSLHNGALRLFFKNYESEDAAHIEQALSTPNDVHLCHALCLDILELGEKFQDEPELAQLLIWAYGNTPSSATRFEIVRLLIKLNAAPLALLEEACHDSDSMTRMFASGALESRHLVQA